MIWEAHNSIQDTLDFLTRTEQSRENHESLTYGIILKKSDQLIGMCGLHSINPVHRRAEMGYVLSPEYWGLGIMTEAVNLLLQTGFLTLELNRIEARTRPDNVASQRVLTKVGLTEEGTLRQQMFIKGQFRDFKIFSILLSEFQHLS
jgi:ribosomal-protein-alanine N-acetyltransferase